MDLLRLEQQRQELENNLQKLRVSLKTWQTWEAEYEGLKEETQRADLNDNDLLDISKTFNGEYVNEKEIREIAGLDKSPRTVSQIAGIITRRQEYVQKNIETVQRQYWDAEAKLEEIDFATFSAHRAADTHLPLTEIHEELDDDDNIVSSHLSQPEAHTEKLVSALRQAGLTEADLSPHAASIQTNGTTEGNSHGAPSHVAASIETDHGDGHNSDTEGDSERPSLRKKSVSFTADTKTPPPPVRTESDDGRKSVSFAPKVAIAPAAPPPDNRSVSFASDVQEIPAEVATAPPSDFSQQHLRQLFKPGDKVGELNDDDELAAMHIVVPEGESEADAATRREMIEYHLNEVGNVVAELDLIEGHDEDGYLDYDGEDAISASDRTASEPYDEDTPYTSAMEDSDEEDEEEDEYGRTTKLMISDDYRKEMQELERRLIGNLGPAPAEDDLDLDGYEIDPNDVRRLVIREQRPARSSVSPGSSEAKATAKKRVSFAEALDVADESEAPPTKAAKKDFGENVPPVTSAVLERDGQSKAGNLKGPAVDASSAAMQYKPIADTLLERPATRHQAPAPVADDPETIMQRRELASEYYKQRNNFIRQQGGFTAEVATDDTIEDNGELMEERDGKLKKVSRFKAARIKP